MKLIIDNLVDKEEEVKLKTLEGITSLIERILNLLIFLKKLVKMKRWTRND